MCESQCSPVWKTGTIALRGHLVLRDSGGGRSLNVVRSGRPEQSLASGVVLPRFSGSQCSPVWKTGTIKNFSDLKAARVAMSQCSPVWKTGTIRRFVISCAACGEGLNVVRSGRPEQSNHTLRWKNIENMSQCSPVWKTGTIGTNCESAYDEVVSQCSPVWKTGTIDQYFTSSISSSSSQCSPVWKTGTMSAVFQLLIDDTSVSM